MPLRTGGIGRIVGRAAYLAGSILLGASTMVALAAIIAGFILAREDGYPNSGMLVFRNAGFALCLAAVLLFIARSLQREVELANNLRLTLDRHGAEWSGHVTGGIRWTDLRHVIVTAHPHGRRRLLLIGKTDVEARLPDQIVNASGLTHLMNRLLTPTRYGLNIVIDQLEQPATVVVTAIRSASKGRFPDALPSDQFPEELHD